MSRKSSEPQGCPRPSRQRREPFHIPMLLHNGQELGRDDGIAMDPWPCPVPGQCVGSLELPGTTPKVEICPWPLSIATISMAWTLLGSFQHCLRSMQC